MHIVDIMKCNINALHTMSRVCVWAREETYIMCAFVWQLKSVGWANVISANWWIMWRIERNGKAGKTDGEKGEGDTHNYRGWWIGYSRYGYKEWGRDNQGRCCMLLLVYMRVCAIWLKLAKEMPMLMKLWWLLFSIVGFHWGRLIWICSNLCLTNNWGNIDTELCGNFEIILSNIWLRSIIFLKTIYRNIIRFKPKFMYFLFSCYVV